MSNAGLEDVVANTSEICDVNGQEGRLSYWGYDIRDLAAGATFEEVVYLLWHGELPDARQLEELKSQLAAERPLPEPIVALLREFPQGATPMDVLRTAVSALAMYDPDGADNSREANVRKSARLTARIPTIVGTYQRLRTGQEPVTPNPALGIAANLLYMLQGQEPDPETAHALDVALILHADHELNASTFAARVAAATLTDMYGAITAAIATLAGPLHGGANQRVMEMLQEIGTPDRAQSYVKEALAARKRIMGFGHRVYRTDDPRATILRVLSRQLGERAGDTRWYEISEGIVGVVKQEKGLYPNVDFYSASAYHSMGIPHDLFTPIFACSRISGWTAHVLEQLANNRLIRPRAEYVGPRNRTFVALDRR